MADRLKQVASHLTNSYPQGLLKDEVVIVTGAAQVCCAHLLYKRCTEGAHPCRVSDEVSRLLPRKKARRSLLASK